MTDMTERTDEHLENTIAYTQRRINDAKNSIKYQTANLEAAEAELKSRQISEKSQATEELINSVINYFALHKIENFRTIKHYTLDSNYSINILKEV